MNANRILRALGPIDVRSIWRDSTLSWMILLPILTSVVLRLGLPALNDALLAEYAFDLEPHYPVTLAYFFVVMTPITFGMVIGFLLLDEKDDNTLTALQVTPLSLGAYFAYRVSIPVLLSIVMILVIFPLSQLVDISWQNTLITAISAASSAPMFALFLAGFAQNKVQGFALTKLSGMLLLAPVLAYFTAAPWDLLFGIIPTYWPMKVYWMLQAGEPGVWPFVLGSLVYPSLLMLLFIRRMYHKLHE